MKQVQKQRLRLKLLSIVALLSASCSSGANAANWACTQDMTPVNLSIEDASNTLKYYFSSGTSLTIPKSYIIDPDQWSGGRQQFVGIGIDVSDMSPLCKNHSRTIDLKYIPNGRSVPDTAHENAIWGAIHPTNLPKGANPIVRGVEDDIKRYTILLNENDQGFYVYKRPMSERDEKSHGPQIFLYPHDKELQKTVHINCRGSAMQTPPYKLKICEVRAYVEPIALHYTFNVIWLKDFKELNEKIRHISNQFLNQ